MSAPEVAEIAALAGDWPAYFRTHAHRWRTHLADQEAGAASAPPPERTTHGGWPQGLAVPGGAAKLIKAADAAGWEARHGYARAWRKGVGRGVFTRTHYVRVQARRAGQQVWATWRRAADDDAMPPPTGWSFDAGAVNGWPATATAITAALRATGDP